jgi:hypothetical protein
MPRDVTLTFDDGSSHQYKGVPDDATPDQITERAGKEFEGKTLTGIDGGKKAAAKVDGSGKAPRTGWDRLTSPMKGRTEGDVAEAAGKELSDVGKGFVSALGKTGAALGQMVEKPAAALINSLAGKKVMSGDVMGRLGEMAKDAGPEDNPIAEAGGGLIADTMGLKALRTFAPGATEAATIPGRIGKAATLGGAGAAATSPSDVGKPYLAEKGAQAGAGAVLGGGLAGLGEGIKTGADFAKRHIFGLQSDEARKVWDKAKDLGFSIRPEQTRADSGRVSQSGLTQEDKLKNADAGARMVSKKVGDETTRLTPDWFDNQFKDLGAKFQSVYTPGTTLKIDKKAYSDLKDLVDQQNALGSPFMSTKASKAANRLITEFEAAGTNASAIKVPADLLQDLRTQLRDSSFDTDNRIASRAMQEVIKSIDGSVARNHPGLKAVLDDASPKYQALLTLEHGRQHGMVDKEGSVDLEGLGEHLTSTDRKMVRGTSKHPLAEAGKLGEQLGIRSLGQPALEGSRWSGAGAEDFVPTRASIWRAGKQYSKVPLRGMHEDYLKSGPGPRNTDVSRYALSGAILGDENK